MNKPRVEQFQLAGASRTMAVAGPREVRGFTMSLGWALMLVAAGLWLAGCAASNGDDSRLPHQGLAMSPQACMANVSLQRGQAPDGSYLIEPSDDLLIDFYLNPEFNQDVTVRPDGKISVRLIGEVPAAGLTPQQLATNLDQAYLRELRAPGVTVTVKNMPSRQIFVEGEVAHPGAFPVESGTTILQAVAEAGGLTKDAGSTAVLIRRDVCGNPARSAISLKRALNRAGSNDDLVLESRDIVVVPPSTIASMDNWVDHYLRRLMPVEPYLAANTPVL
ncbi:MAG TPA: polysaccharide biosynthesis/export family protein [Candidatus Binataceae bacterium]|nr:polysaccharide biosynthesis/export family protein [Candidatus Binataceae bacterium]